MKIRIVKEDEQNSLLDDNLLDDIPSVNIDVDDNNNMTLQLSAFFHSKDNGKIALLKNNPVLQDVLMKAIQVEAQKMFRKTVHGILGLPFGLKEEEDFTPIEDPKEPKPEAKQFQILASMITNTKVNDQTNILSAMRALPGVTIVNSQAAVPGSNSEGQLRYKTNVDIKIDTSAIEGDVKEGIKKIVEDIKNIEGVVEFKLLPKAKETTPY
jgi:hypothetical protein